MKIVHAADLHIDSPLVGLDRYPGCPADTMREATRRAFEGVVALCVRERAGLLLLAGDVFDGDWKDYNAGLYFASALAPLADVGTEVAIVRGNHDAANEMTRTLRLPPRVHTFGTSRGETKRYEALGVAVHGMSYPVRDVTEDLVPRYPDPLPGLLNLGLLHTNVGGSRDHAAYAPTTTAVLAARGYDYWALGHVHEHAILGREPWIVYPGNTQGRSVREVGPRGCMLLDVDDASRRIVNVERVMVDAARWAHLVVELEANDGVDAAYERVRAALAGAIGAAEGRTVAARVELRGVTRAHAALSASPEAVATQVRSDAAGSGADVWIEKVKVRTRAASTGGGAVRAEVRKVVEELRAEPALLAEVMAGADQELAQVLDLLRRQEHEPAGLEVPDPRDEEGWARLLDAAEDVLGARIGGAA